MSAIAEQPVSEAWLLDRYHRIGDRSARERLVARLMPLVRRIASGYGRPRDQDDLVQAACLGLVKAIDRWDPSRSRDLRTYAVPTMHGEVRRWLRDHSWAIHVPRPLQEQVLAVSKATEKLGAQTGRAPTAPEIADELDLPLEDVLEALQAGRAYGAASLDAPLGRGEEATTLGELLGGDDDRFARADEVASLGALRGELDDHERLVLHLRFVEDLTQSQIAARVGCSQMQISRILRRTLDRLGEKAATA